MNLLNLEHYMGYVAPSSERQIKALYGGVDPGKHGGVSLITDDRTIVCCVDTPTFEAANSSGKKKVEYDIPATEKILRSWVELAESLGVPLYVTIEQFVPVNKEMFRQNQNPEGGNIRISGQHEKAMGYMMWITLFQVLRMSYTKKVPVKWKRDIGVTSDKETSFLKAEQLFPETVDLRLFQKPRSTKKKNTLDGRAESLLIAEWQYRDICQAKEVKPKRVRSAA